MNLNISNDKLFQFLARVCKTDNITFVIPMFEAVTKEEFIEFIKSYKPFNWSNQDYHLSKIIRSHNWEFTEDELEEFLNIKNLFPSDDQKLDKDKKDLIVALLQKCKISKEFFISNYSLLNPFKRTIQIKNPEIFKSEDVKLLREIDGSASGRSSNAVKEDNLNNNRANAYKSLKLLTDEEIEEHPKVVDWAYLISKYVKDGEVQKMPEREHNLFQKVVFPQNISDDTNIFSLDKVTESENIYYYILEFFPIETVVANSLTLTFLYDYETVLKHRSLFAGSIWKMLPWPQGKYIKKTVQEIESLIDSLDFKEFRNLVVSEFFDKHNGKYSIRNLRKNFNHYYRISEKMSTKNSWYYSPNSTIVDKTIKLFYQ